MTKTGDAALPPLDLESTSAIDFLQRYQRPLIIGAIVVAALGVGVWLYQRSAEIREVRAAEALGQAEAAYNSGGIAGGQTELAKILARYGGTTAGAQAAALSAQWYFEAGQVDSGLVQLNIGLSKAPSYMRAGLLALRAAGQGAKGDAAAAALDFEAAAAAAQFEQERDQLLMQAAREHASAGNLEKAKALYGAIAAREDSSHSIEARLRLGELTAKG